MRYSAAPAVIEGVILIIQAIFMFLMCRLYGF